MVLKYKIRKLQSYTSTKKLFQFLNVFHQVRKEKVNSIFDQKYCGLYSKKKSMLRFQSTLFM